MEEKLKQAALRLQEVELLLAQPEVYADPVRLRALTREQKELTTEVSAFGELEAARAMQSEAEQVLSDPELRELALGGTAVGTGLNAPKGFDVKVA